MEDRKRRAAFPCPAMCSPSGPVGPFTNGYQYLAGPLVYGAPCVAPLVRVENVLDVPVVVSRIALKEDPGAGIATIETTYSSISVQPGGTAIFTDLRPDEKPVIALQIQGANTLSAYRFLWSPTCGYTLLAYPTRYNLSTESFMDFHFPSEKIDPLGTLPLELCGCSGKESLLRPTLLVCFRTRRRREPLVT
jgi:hypothetical protein